MIAGLWAYRENRLRAGDAHPNRKYVASVLLPVYADLHAVDERAD